MHIYDAKSYKIPKTLIETLKYLVKNKLKLK